MRKTFTTAKVALSALFLGLGMAMNVSAAENVQTRAAVQLEMDKQYTVSTANPLDGYFTAPSNGTLTVVQTGTSDPHLYKTAGDTSESNWYPTDGYTPGLGTYTLTYIIPKGTTVYFYGPVNSYDSLTKVQFSWEGDEADVPVIQEGTPFVSFNQLMAYTPTQDGILTITANTTFQFNWGSSSNAVGLLFFDLGHTLKVPLSFVGNDVDAKPSQ